MVRCIGPIRQLRYAFVLFASLSTSGGDDLAVPAWASRRIKVRLHHASARGR
jgi:hypothetical protein